YYSINITGTGNAANFSLPTKSSNLSSTGTTVFYNAKFIPLLPNIPTVASNLLLSILAILTPKQLRTITFPIIQI
ncbi:MAG: hypothetical protein WCF97_10265, partial [Nitrososphaeraceae archaeon]